MKKSFPSYYLPSDRELQKLWKTATFILDANVILNLYRYPKGAREDLLNVFQKISDRLWIPHQAALEYQKNRLGVIAEQMKRFDDVRKLLTDTTNHLKEKLAQLQLRKRHSSIDAGSLLAKMDNIVNGFLFDIDKSEKNQSEIFNEDKLRSKIDALLRGKVGSPAGSQAELDAIYQEGKTRYDLKIPPGYGDTSKGKPDDKKTECYIYNDLLLRREYGDLIIWYQIIKEAKERNWKQIVFITDDRKDDWWWIVESKGKKVIGPRPELVDEIMTKANVSSFYMYNSERFLEYAKKYLKTQVEQESIEQVREVTSILQAERQLDPYGFYSSVEEACLKWLYIQFPYDEISRNGGVADIVHINHKDNSRTGYTIKYFRDFGTRDIISVSRELTSRLRYSLEMGLGEIRRGYFSNFKTVVVLENENRIREIEKVLNNLRLDLQTGVDIMVGKLIFRDDGFPTTFVPLF